MSSWLLRALLVLLSASVLVLVISHQRQISAALSSSPAQGAQIFIGSPAMAGEGWRAISWRLASAAIPESAELDILLREVSRVYPLEGMLWLRRAEIAATLGSDQASLARLLDLTRELSPFSSEVIWRAAVVAAQTGDDQRTLALTSHLFSQEPSSVYRVLPLAIRAAQDDAWLTQWLNDADASKLNLAMSWLAGRGHFDLADEVRSLLDADAIDTGAAAIHVRSLFRSGQTPAAVNMWIQQEPEFAENGVANADFAWDVGNNGRAFDWEGEPSASVLWRRDFVDPFMPPASLQWYFSGEHNVALDSPRLPLVVKPGHLYRLELQWRAESLTSASLPELQIVDRRRSTVLAQYPSPSNAWDWSAAQLEFVAPADAQYVYFRLAREPTGLLNRQLGGSINVDRLRLHELGPVER